MTGAPRPSYTNALTKLCQDGLDIARYLHQCPEDLGERARLKKILGEIQRDPTVRMRREFPKIAIEMERTLRGEADQMSAETLAEGFERMTRLCDMAKSGLL
ncbi:MAG: hypothetical protein O7F70_09525 [Gemmatimonadetes bacterium]|nr:hypothetical protein [Gemmatimonadota bacterium]